MTIELLTHPEQMDKVMQYIKQGLSKIEGRGGGFKEVLERFCLRYWKLRGKRVQQPCTQKQLFALHTFGSQSGLTKHKIRVQL